MSVTPEGHEPVGESLVRGNHQQEVTDGAPSVKTPARCKKKYVGLALMVVGLICLMVAAIFWTNSGGMNTAYKTREEFTQKVESLVADSKTKYCSSAADTLFAKEFQKIADKADRSVEDLFLCAEVDLTSYQQLKASTTQNPSIILGIYSGQDLADENLKSLRESLKKGPEEWGIAGRNWMLVGARVPGLKDKALDAVGGAEILAR